MTTKNTQGRISYLCFTTAQWETKSSIVLNNGEFGFEKTTNDVKLKIGDGSRTWVELPYVTDATGYDQFGSLGALDSDNEIFDFGSVGIGGYNIPISTYIAHDVIDNLTSTSMDALSANQGRVLKGLIDGLTTRYTNITNAIENSYGYNTVPKYNVGGTIFYIDPTPNGASYTFYDENENVLNEVGIGDNPAYYSIKGHP